MALKAAAAATLRRLCTAAAGVAAGTTSGSTLEKVELPLYRRLSALGGAPVGSVTKTMNKWLREGKSVRAKEIVTYVKELRKYGRYKHALELMEWMEMRGMNMSYGNHALRLDLLAKAKGIDSAEKYFIDLSEPAKNHLTYGSLLNVYCVGKMEDKAMQLYEMMKQLNYDSSTLVYNNIMNLCLKTGKPAKLPFLLQEMKSKNIICDHFTYNMLITYYSSVGEMEAMEKLLHDMEDGNASPSRWHVYGHAASIFIDAGFVEKAKSSIKKLEESMDKKDRLAYHFLISLHARLGNLLDVKNVWTSLAAKMKTNNKSYLVMFQALDKLNDIGALKSYFEEWNSSCRSYDIRLANVVIGAYLKREMVYEAESLKESFACNGAAPDSRTFDLFIHYYLRKGEISSALKCFEDAVVNLKVWNPKQEMVDAIFTCLEEKKDVAGAEAFRKSLKDVRYKESQGYDSKQQNVFPSDENKPFTSVDDESDVGRILRT